MNLADSLRALGADDETQVPAHVDVAVMAAWEASRRSAVRTSAPWAVSLAACATVVVAAALLTWRLGGSETTRRITPSTPLIQQEVVLVPELDSGDPLMLMRVRMTRREFSRLGVPISNPEDDGLVDVEVLVGEDGVARSIRRAVAVGSAGQDQ